MVIGHAALPPPEYLLWEITLRCNLACLHCAGGAGRARREELSTKEALELCSQIADLGVPSVALMGGEPLMRKDWKLLAGKLRSSGIQVGIITNGSLFDERAARSVQDLGIVQVGVSLDAATAEVHDFIRRSKKSFEKALRAIRILNSLGIPHPTVITSVNKHNLEELPRMLDLLLENTQNFMWIINHSTDHRTRSREGRWTIDSDDFVALAGFINRQRRECRGRINITGTHGLGYYSKRYSGLHDFEWEGCLAGVKAIGVRSNGDVVGCLILPDPFIEGNVRERPLANIWKGDGAFLYTRKFDGRKLRGKCRGCRHARACRAGCTNVAYVTTGTIYEAPFCLNAMERQADVE